MRHIVALTGIRSEYDILHAVFKAMQARSDISLSLIVTGAHLSPRFGMTIDEIRKDGFDIVETIDNLQDEDRDVSRLIGAAIQLHGLARAVDRLRPDLLLAFGDREESINMALVGSYLNIPVAHIAGGDRVIGNVDDQVRHATTKLAHLHLTTNEESKERILKMGEQPFRVLNVGNPGLDRLAQTEMLSREALLRWYGFEDAAFGKPLLVVLQHVISSEIEDAYRQMKITMEVVERLAMNTVLICPNSDPGNRDLVRCIEEYAELPFLRIFKNIPRVPFVNTLRQASCLLGNSSAGILEAPFLKLPVVNVGNRQKARLHAENVQFVPHDAQQIETAVRRACFDETYRAQVAQCRNPYGDGKSGERIAKILAEIPLDDTLLIKDITY